MMENRSYQTAAVANVFKELQEVRGVCLVMVTGSGKTETAQLCIEQAWTPTLFTVHRKELLKQSYRRLAARFGETVCGIVAAGHPPNPDAMIQVSMLQTMVARGVRPPAKFVINDECHHMPSDEYAIVQAHYYDAKWLGLTATPERADGRALGGIYERMVVGANYSPMLAGKFLVPCQVFRAPEDQDLGEGTALAQDPVAAYERHARGTQAIVFSPSVKLAYEHAAQFTAAGYPAACIEAETKASVRDDLIERFRAGELRVLTNVNIMTEGLDLPSVETVILARAFRHVSAYLQAVGRVLRPAPGKTRAICIDLTGASHHHGLPTENREYSLEGEAIRRTTNEALTTCQECGATYPGGLRTCPVCGFERPLKTPRPPKIYSIELQEVWAGEDTPSEAKEREWKRLLAVSEARGFTLSWAAAQYEKSFGARPEIEVGEDERMTECRRLVARCVDKGWSLGFAVKQYKQTFGEAPDLSWVGDAARETELERLIATASARGYKPGWAAYQYKTLFGGWPRRMPRMAAQ
jgi:DNA repair protein RadD